MAEDEQGEDLTQQLTGFMEAIGIKPEDVPELMQQMLAVNEEDRQFRAEVMHRFEALLENQQKIYSVVQALMAPLAELVPEPPKEQA